MAGIRLSGLASGIDTETMIKQLMTAERAPVDRLAQKKQTLTWQRDAYREINRALLDFRTASSDMLLSKNYMSKAATSSDSSKISVTASPSANAGSLTIDSVTHLASSSSLTMERNGGASGTITGKTTLKDSGIVGIDAATQKTNLELTTYAADGSGTAKTVKLELSETATIEDLVNQINSNKELGLSAVFNDLTGKLVLSRQATGKLKATDEIVWTDNGSIALAPVKTTQAGANAEYTIGGTTLEQTTNMFTQNGVSITLNTITTAPVTITTKNDIQANFDSIKKFVDKYNDLIDKMNKKVREEKYSDYKPLTDAQRKELSEDEVKKWEEKAMSGVLRNDSYLRSTMQDLRSTLSNKIESGYTYVEDNKTIGLQYMSQIGITTTSDFRDGGKLKIDETKLKKMLEEHPDGVYKLFTATAPPPPPLPATPDPNIGKDGFARQLQTFATASRTKISQVAGLDGAVATTYRLGKSLAEVDKSIMTWEDKLQRKEDAYYRRFAAMEQAMNQANSQSATLAGYLGQ
ncbi:flagellar filament capping protein FliD [Exiguobacterium flavidum]|uniref:flagellar filament capping protein FliD n=1 Tax=Exiguobacterium flavidum TaxID=2184695 RepID=UPI000DF7BB92|nr:flagellar filament capping protein FliD [Exiguobacterium flavidum]